MYKVFCDGFPLYDYRTDKYPLFDTLLELELNKAGAFTFTIRTNHPNFSVIQKMRSIIVVYQGDDLIFRGRVLDVEEGFYNEMQVTCEGELAFLLDSVIRPYGSEGSPWNGTPEEYLTKLLDEHNAQVDEWKRFYVGTVTVEAKADTGNITRYDGDYKITWDLISEKLVDSLGGYLWVRGGADGKNYIDYLADINVLSNQTIELGKNLLDLKKKTSGADIMTAIIPVGGSGDTKINISGLPDGEVGRVDFEGKDGILYKKGDYIYCDKAVEKYGWIYKAVSWGDVESDVDYLQKEAIKELTEKVIMLSTIELTAADLAGIKDVNPFKLGVKITAKSKPHNLNADLKFLVKKLTIDLLNPANNKLTINDTFKSYTQSNAEAIRLQAAISERVDKVEQHVAGYVTSEQLSSAVMQSSKEIMTQVSEDYYLKNDAEKLLESLGTQFTQTSEQFEFQFKEFNQSLTDVENNVNAQFSDISKYIRFVDGNIILGESGNELILRIENDRISFLDAGAEVAYFSNKQLTVTDGSFLNSLKIGKFAFIPRQNGNLSLVKVG